MCGTTIGEETYGALTIEQTLELMLECIIDDSNKWRRDTMEEIRCTLLNVIISVSDGIPDWNFGVQSICIQPGVPLEAYCCPIVNSPCDLQECSSCVFLDQQIEEESW